MTEQELRDRIRRQIKTYEQRLLFIQDERNAEARKARAMIYSAVISDLERIVGRED